MSKQHTAQAPVDPIVLGKMGSSYGIRGWLRVFSSTEDAQSIFDYQPWLIQKAGQWQTVELESWRYHNQDIVIKLKGVDDRDAANLLTNCEIIVDSSQLPALDDGRRLRPHVFAAGLRAPGGEARLHHRPADWLAGVYRHP